LERLIIASRIQRNHKRRSVKKIRNGIIGVVILGGTFLGGSFVQANSDFMGQLTSKAAQEISKDTYDKRQEIISDIENNLAGEVQKSLQPVIDEKTDKAIKSLEDYADQKLQNITESEEFSGFEKQLDDKKDIVLERHKNAIDDAIEEALGG